MIAYFEKAIASYFENKGTIRIIHPGEKEIKFQNGNKRTFKYEENLTKQLREIFSDILVVYQTFVITKDGDTLGKSYRIFYRIKNELYSFYLTVEKNGNIVRSDRLKIQLWDQNGEKWNYCGEKPFTPTDEDYQKHESIMDAFKESIYNQKNYRLYKVTGIL